MPIDPQETRPGDNRARFTLNTFEHKPRYREITTAPSEADARPPSGPEGGGDPPEDPERGRPLAPPQPPRAGGPRAGVHVPPRRGGVDRAGPPDGDPGGGRDPGGPPREDVPRIRHPRRVFPGDPLETRRDGPGFRPPRRGPRIRAGGVLEVRPGQKTGARGEDSSARDEPGGDGGDPGGDEGGARGEDPRGDPRGPGDPPRRAAP